MDKITVLCKEAFLQQYVLNRAKVVDNLRGAAATKEAMLAWDIIAKELAPNESVAT